MDLNIIVEDCGVRDSDEMIISKLQRAAKLGLTTVALTVRICPTDLASVCVPDPPAIQQPSETKLAIMTRLTIAIGNDDKILYKVLQDPNCKSYSFLAFEPLEEKIFSQITGGSVPCDIVTFDMSQRMDVDLRKANFNLLRLRGTCFEINFSDAFKSQTSRQYTISSAQLLVEKTRGRNIIISSGARSPLHLRAPCDVSTLAFLFGLKETQAKQSVFVNGHLAIKHSEIRRNPNSSVVSVAGQDDQWLVQKLQKSANSSRKKKKGLLVTDDEPPNKALRSET